MRSFQNLSGINRHLNECKARQNVEAPESETTAQGVSFIQEIDLGSSNSSATAITTANLSSAHFVDHVNTVQTSTTASSSITTLVSAYNGGLEPTSAVNTEECLASSQVGTYIDLLLNNTNSKSKMSVFVPRICITEVAFSWYTCC